MKLERLFEEIGGVKENFKDVNVTGIAMDSRKVKAGFLFFANSGYETDGHDYISNAIEKGAVAVAYTDQAFDISPWGDKIAFIKVTNMVETMAHVANVFYNYPSKKLKMFAVTGTNGKSTTSSLIRDILENGEGIHIPCGYIGTISTNGIEEEITPHLTTPENIDLQKSLHAMVEKGMLAASIEVSSHGLEQGRVKDTDFDTAIFTNLTHDHLDYHKTIDDYFAAKQLLFKQIKPEGVAILNRDDWTYDTLSEVCACPYYSYGMGEYCDYRIEDAKLRGDGSCFTLCISATAMQAHAAARREKKGFVEETEGSALYKIETNLLALYNIYNLVAAVAAIHQNGIAIEDFIGRLNNLAQVDGRMESIPNSMGINIIVDYAHTPDAFDKIYEFVDAVKGQAVSGIKDREHSSKVYSVFGSAGKRDKSKRPVMGKIAAAHSDHVFLTEEDPRDEAPKAIALGIKGNLPDEKISIIEEREKAIKKAIEVAKRGDIVLILGKGGETFMDRTQINEYWEGDNVLARKIAETIFKSK